VDLDELRISRAALVRVAQAASVFGVDVRTVTRAIENGELPALRLGRRVLIPRLPLLAALGVRVDDALMKFTTQAPATGRHATRQGTHRPRPASVCVSPDYVSGSRRDCVASAAVHWPPVRWSPPKSPLPRTRVVILRVILPPAPLAVSGCQFVSVGVPWGRHRCRSRPLKGCGCLAVTRSSSPPSDTPAIRRHRSQGSGDVQLIGFPGRALASTARAREANSLTGPSSCHFHQPHRTASSAPNRPRR
jgi:excisionase family DNA binding protein